LTSLGVAFGRILTVASLVAVPSACGILEQVLPPGDARWALTEDADVGPGTVEFSAMVTEVQCAGGQSSEGRIAGPEISYTDETVTVTLGVRRLSGANSCPGNPPTAVTVRLDEPLGDRVLLDGGTDPPREPPVCTSLDFCE